MSKQNELLRSAYSIAKRKGVDTNWDAFERSVLELLMKQQDCAVETPAVSDVVAHLKLGDRIELNCPHLGLQTGVLVHVFRADNRRRTKDVLKYYVSRKAVAYGMVTKRYDELVFEREDGSHFGFFNNPRYLNKVRLERVELRRKCKIPGCENWSDQGQFVGDYCAPCASLNRFSAAYELRHKAQQDLALINKMLSHVE